MSFFKAVAGFASAIAIMAVLGSAQAQTANANAGAASQSNSSSGSASGARAQSGGGNQAITFNSTTPTDTRNTTTLNSNQSGGTNNRDAVSYSGGTTSYNRNDGDVTVRTTPTVYAPPVSGGNPCTLAVSGGVSVIGWGAAAGGTFVDEACATRQKIAMIHNAGYAGAAKELMCDDKATYFAFRTAGQPCAYRAGFEGGAPAPQQPVVYQQQPTPIAPVAAPVVQPRTAVVKDRTNLPRCKGPNDQGPCYGG